MKKYKHFTVLMITAVLVLLFFLTSCKKKEEVILLEEQEEVLENTSKIDENTVAEAPKQALYVYICGAVVNPGVYEMKPGNRITDVLDKAGGFTKEACRNYVNLAKRIEDEEKIFIPRKDEIFDLSDELKKPLNQNSKKININTADVQELKELPGIGDSKAGAIIEHRQKYGKYKKIEDIMKISGIKEAMFYKIKDRISVD